jgi:hypothetical protein
MTTDKFQAVRAVLSRGRLALEAGNATNEDLRAYIQLVEERLTPGHTQYDGDVQMACTDLRKLLGNLVELKAAPHSTATAFDRLSPAASEQAYLPGVAEAVSSVGKAIDLLRWME